MQLSAHWQLCDERPGMIEKKGFMIPKRDRKQSVWTTIDELQSHPPTPGHMYAIKIYNMRQQDMRDLVSDNRI